MRAGRRRRVEARQTDGADRVEEAGTLRQGVVAGILLRGVVENRLHRVGCERRICLKHQRNGAGDDRRRHARAAEAQIRKIRRRDRTREQCRNLGLIVMTLRCRERHGASSRRNQIGLRDKIDVGRTTRAVAADHIVGAV